MLFCFCFVSEMTVCAVHVCIFACDFAAVCMCVCAHMRECVKYLERREVGNLLHATATTGLEVTAFGLNFTAIFSRFTFEIEVFRVKFWFFDLISSNFMHAYISWFSNHYFHCISISFHILIRKASEWTMRRIILYVSSLLCRRFCLWICACGYNKLWRYSIESKTRSLTDEVTRSTALLNGGSH